MTNRCAILLIIVLCETLIYGQTLNNNDNDQNANNNCNNEWSFQTFYDLINFDLLSLKCYKPSPLQNCINFCLLVRNLTGECQICHKSGCTDRLCAHRGKCHCLEDTN